MDGKEVLRMHHLMTNNNLPELVIQHNKFLKIFWDMHISMADSNLQDWTEKKIEYLLLKFGLHQKSLAKIFEPVCLDETNKVEALDISSIYLLSTALIENYLTIFHLYLFPENPNQVELVHKIYECLLSILLAPPSTAQVLILLC